MGVQFLPIAITFSLLTAFVSLPPPAVASPTAFEVIGGFNFPEGILPKGITGYELDEATGNFRAFFNGSCNFGVEGSRFASADLYPIEFKPTVSGYISQNRVKDLTGVSVKIVFLWLNVVEVVRCGNELMFYFGAGTSLNFPVDNFFESPQCGCGFDCVSAGTRKVRTIQKNLSI